MHPDFIEYAAERWTHQGLKANFLERLHDGLKYPEINGRGFYHNDDDFSSQGHFGEFRAPALRVMLIDRSATEPHVATRVNIGQVFLRRWVQAQSRFETVILA
jgi:hypothetical protein